MSEESGEGVESCSVTTSVNVERAVTPLFYYRCARFAITAPQRLR